MERNAGIFKCDFCGQMVEILHPGVGTLVCCGQPMKKLEENTTDAATEKHVPVTAKSGAGITVTVGSVPHPMEEKHYIEWVEIVDDDRTMRRFLSPGKKPEASFQEEKGAGVVRAYCNIHGLWKE